MTLTTTDLAPRLRLAVMRLARRLRQQGDETITPSQMSALATIERHGPITLGELAAHERVQPPTMTRIVAGLLEQGLIAREADAEDRRVARVRLTVDGRRALERSRTRKTAYLAARLRGFDPDEMELLERALPLIERLVEEKR
jgi:DNA-binding MarR family transcriptional regulator